MFNLYVKRNRVGSTPGSVLSDATEKPFVKLISYNHDSYVKKDVEDFNDIKQLPKDEIHWISVVGQMHHDTVIKIQDIFSLHPLLCEDIVNTDQRPKFESFDNCEAVFIRSMRRTASYQVAVVFMDNVVITFSELDIFDPLETRIREAKGRIRKKSGDYLVYAVLDIVVDGYFYALEQLGRKLEGLETPALEAESDKVLHDLHDIKKSVMLIRRAASPLREMMSGLLRDMDETPYFRDLFDHAIRVAESADSYRDMITNLQEVYMTGVGNKLNRIMKVLTLISVLFIPITFITGFFGMNFRDMSPILSDHHVYYGTVGGMVFLSILLIVIFKLKKWM